MIADQIEPGFIKMFGDNRSGELTKPGMFMETEREEIRRARDLLDDLLDQSDAVGVLPTPTDGRYQGRNMRVPSIELEREEGTEAPPVIPPTFEFKGRQMSFREAFADAVFKLNNVGGHSTIPAEDEGWGTTQLRALMTDFADTTLSRPDWHQQLL